MGLQTVYEHAYQPVLYCVWKLQASMNGLGIEECGKGWVVAWTRVRP